MAECRRKSASSMLERGRSSEGGITRDPQSRARGIPHPRVLRLPGRAMCRRKYADHADATSRAAGDRDGRARTRTTSRQTEAAAAHRRGSETESMPSASPASPDRTMSVESSAPEHRPGEPADTADHDREARCDGRKPVLGHIRRGSAGAWRSTPAGANSRRNRQSRPEPIPPDRR